MIRSCVSFPSPIRPRAPLKRIAMGFIVALSTFAALGTVSAVWDNSLFTRMTSTGAWATTAGLLLFSLLAGIFVVIRQPSCSVRLASAGGIIGFLGIACPTCNKVLMLLVDGELLLAHFEPNSLYVATAGVPVLGAATGREIFLRRRSVFAYPIDEALR